MIALVFNENIIKSFTCAYFKYDTIIYAIKQILILFDDLQSVNPLTWFYLGPNHVNGTSKNLSSFYWRC